MSEMETPSAKALDMRIYGNAPRKGFQLSEGKQKGYADINARYKEYSKTAAERRKEESNQYTESNPFTVNDDLLRFYASSTFQFDDNALDQVFGNAAANPPLLGDERMKERLRMDLRSKLLKEKSDKKFGPLEARSLKDFRQGMAFETTTNNAYSYDETLGKKARMEISRFGNISTRDNLY